MASSFGYGAAHAALEVGNQFAGYVSSVQLPGYEVAQAATGGATGQAGRVGITPMFASFRPAEAVALLDWALSLPRGKAIEQDGAVLVVDHNFKLKRRVGWGRGLATELRLPVLDAKETKKAFELGLGWLPASVSHEPASGSLSLEPVAKPILASNFRVKGLPFAGIDIGRVELPTIKAAVTTESSTGRRGPQRRYGAVDLGQLTVHGSALSLDAALAYVHKVIQDGTVADKERFGITIELLDPALKSVLATITLAGCGLLRYAESVAGTVDQQPSYRLTFSVGQVELKLNTAKAPK